MRKLAVAAATLVLIVLIGIAGYVYMQRENLVGRAIEHYGSDILGAAVRVDGVHLSPVNGDGAIRGLNIGNPAGFLRDVARVESIELALDPKTIMDDVVQVRRIALHSPGIVYEQTRNGTNLDALQRNASRYIGSTSPKERQASTRFIIDRLVNRGARVTYIPLSGASNAAITIRLPDIALSNIGKRRGGVTASELTKIIMDALLARTTAALGQRALEHTVERLFGR